MSKTPRYTERFEYGGGDGSDYLTPNGTPRRRSVGERARLLRSEMQHSDRPGDSAENSEKVVSDFRP